MSAMPVWEAAELLADRVRVALWACDDPADPSVVAQRFGAQVRVVDMFGVADGVVLRRPGGDPVIAVDAHVGDRRLAVAHCLGHVVDRELLSEDPSRGYGFVDARLPVGRPADVHELFAERLLGRPSRAAGSVGGRPRRGGGTGRRLPAC